jgi:hypothetical protein
MADAAGGDDQRPIVALDVDGVLAPWLRPEYGRWLLALVDRCELVWATSWEHDANGHIAPVIGLPLLRVIEFPQAVKLPSVDAWCGSRPLAWIDDFFDPAADSWADARNARGVPTLLVHVNSKKGLSARHCDAVSAWLDSLAQPTCF